MGRREERKPGNERGQEGQVLVPIAALRTGTVRAPEIGARVGDADAPFGSSVEAA